MLSLCITPAYLYDLESMTKKQQKVHVCGSNCLRRIDKRLAELREEVGVKESFRGKLVRSWLKWAGHNERMEEEMLTKERMRSEWRANGEKYDRD